MDNLKNKKCVPCKAGVSSFNIDEIHKYQKKVDGWDVKKNLSLKILLKVKNLLIKLA